jgi:sortase A
MVLRWIGRGLLGLGILVLAFIVYQLYGTDLITHRYQAELKHRFQAGIAQAEKVPARSLPAGVTPTASPSASGQAGHVIDLSGGAVALIDIPKINLDMVVVQGVSAADLQKGPGHYPSTPSPGQPGNVGIAGHRTTYLHPFRHLGQLRPGDPIYLTTPQGIRYTYLVVRSFVVLPGNRAVLADTTDNRLTLTTCTPPFSASHRLIVVAELQPGHS